MKKITEVTGLDGKQNTLAEIAEEYFDSLAIEKKVGKSAGVKGVDYKTNKPVNYGLTSLIGRIKKEIDNKNAFEKFLKEEILDEKNNYKKLRTIILGKPNELTKLIYSFRRYFKKENIKLFEFKKGNIKEKKKHILFEIFENIFDYSALVDNEWLGKKLNIKVCPYCNNQYTQTLEKADKTHKVQFQLDHFYPKSIYPYLAISFYNLIPSCANCNLSKSNHDTFKDNLIHPYEDSFHHLAKFRTKESSDKELVNNFLENGDFRAKNIDIELFSADKRVEQHKKIFHLEDIYKQHQDVVAEIYTKSYLYPSTRRDELKNMFNDSKLSLFSEEELKRFVLGNYTDEKDFHLRPLSKLTHDIAQELGLL
jgi:hypothetical protein